MVDLNFNAISLGVEYGQLTAEEKRLLFDCMSRLLPFGWSEDVVHTWYGNRKLAVVRDGAVTHFYGLTPVNQWRLLLDTEKKTVDGKATTVLTWKVGTFQWLPIEAAVAHQELLKGSRR
jgi:hypothetical protein